jgi:hypothetical protein
MKINNLIEKLNFECANKRKDFFNKWTERDVEITENEFWYRDYCYNAYKTFDLCDNCSRTLNKKNAKYDCSPAIMKEYMQKTNERIVQLEDKIELLMKVNKNLT